MSDLNGNHIYGLHMMRLIIILSRLIDVYCHGYITAIMSVLMSSPRQHVREIHTSPYTSLPSTFISKLGCISDPKFIESEDVCIQGFAFFFLIFYPTLVLGIR